MGEKSMKDIDYIMAHNCGAFSNGWNWGAFGNDRNWMIDPKKWDKFIDSFIDSLGKSNEEKPHIPDIKNVIFHDPATIVWWEDGTKTVVKAYGDKFDAEKGLTMAIAKKALGNKGNYYEVIKKWVGDLMPRCEGVAEKKTLKKSKKDGDVGEEIKKTVEYERKNKKKRN